MKNNKKNISKILLILLAIVIALVVGIGGWLLGIKFFEKEDSVISSSKGTNLSENKNKEIVYDALYVKIEYSNYHEEYSNGIISNNENIKLPYINLNSEDASKINEEMKLIYTSLEKDIQDSLTCDDSTSIHYSLGYKTYKNGNILSIVVLKLSGTDYPEPSYWIYNFDLTTGNLLTLEDILNIKNISREDFFMQAKKVMEQYALENNGDACDYFGNLLVTYDALEKSMENNSLPVEENSNTFGYFMDENGNIQFVTTIYMACGRGAMVQTFSLE